MNGWRAITAWLVTLAAVLAPTLRAQENPLSAASAAEIAAGKQIFDAQCAWCHGTGGAGGSGPGLQRPVLRHARSDTDLVGIVRNGIPSTEMPSFVWSLTDAMAWRTAAYVRSLGRVAHQPLPGNGERGAAVYEARGCQACHTIAGRGGTLGPVLTAIGTLRGPSHLRQSIVEPEAAHPAGYLVVRVVSRSGLDIRGIRVDEDAFWMHVRDSSGQLHVLEKKDLVKIDRELSGTLMPSYATLVTPAELDDLVAYLASQRGER
jgi:putative heme-binding domain-containing protein